MRHSNIRKNNLITHWPTKTYHISFGMKRSKLHIVIITNEYVTCYYHVCSSDLGLIKEAYIEEFKKYVNRLAKGIEISSELGPMIKQYLTDQKMSDKTKKSSNVLPLSIISSSIFIGSTLIFPYERNLSYLGFGLSAALLVGTLAYNKLNR